MVKNVKVLGMGCASCKATLKLVEEVAKGKGVAIHLEKVENPQEILRYGVMSTPGVVVDGKLVHSGGIPERSKVEDWL